MRERAQYKSERRDAKRRNGRKMVVSNRSIFTIQAVVRKKAKQARRELLRA